MVVGLLPFEPELKRVGCAGGDGDRIVPSWQDDEIHGGPLKRSNGGLQGYDVGGVYQAVGAVRHGVQNAAAAGAPEGIRDVPGR